MTTCKGKMRLCVGVQVQALSFTEKKSSAAHRPPATCSLLAGRATTLEHGSGGEAAVRGGLRFARRGG